MMDPAQTGNGAGGDRPLIALTGATGFLGSHIADTLLAQGFQVRASIRPTSNLRWLQDMPIETVTVNLVDQADCRRLMAGTDGLIHCAGLVAGLTEEAYQLANVATTEALLAAAAEVWQESDSSQPTPAFVLISSLAAHGPAGLDRPATESDACQPVSAYGRSKLAAENILLGGGWKFRTAVLRPPALYGPRDAEFLPLLKFAMQGWLPRIGRTLRGLSLVDGRDAAGAAVALLTTPTAKGIFFVDDGQAGYSWPDLKGALCQAAGRNVRILPIPLVLLRIAAFLTGPQRANRSPLLNPGRLHDLTLVGWVCNGDLLVEKTGFRPRRNAATGLKNTLAFYREQGWL